MSDLGWIDIVGWDEFQHADVARPKKGNSTFPWIRVYTRLLHDDRFLGLAPGMRAVLFQLWLEYASSPPRDRLVTGSTPRRLRADTTSLTRRFNMRVTSAQLISLEQAGFITLSASSVQAERKQNASLARAQRREEMRGEETSSQVEGIDTTQASRLDSTESDNENNVEEWVRADADEYGPQPLAAAVTDELERLRRQFGETA